MRRLLIGLTLVGMAALIPLWSHADDQQIANKIIQQLQQHKEAGALKGFGIDLQVEEGVVRLDGRVSTPAQERLALDAARRVGGVKRVVNRLTVTGKPFVQPAGTTGSQPIAARAYNATLAKLKGALDVTTKSPVQLASTSTDQQAAEALVAQQDQQVAELVAKALKDRKDAGDLKAFRVNLSVDRGTVWLEGDVSSREQRTLVLDAARRVPGVKQVVNELAIRKQDPAILVAAKGQPKLEEEVVAAPAVAPIPVAETKPAAEVVVAPEAKPEPVVQAKPEVIAEAKPPVEAVKAPEQVAALPQQAVGTAVGEPAQPQVLAAAPVAQLPAPQQVVSQPVPMTYVAQVQPPAYVPGHAASVPSPVARTRYDHPQMPAYAWPTYASHPNYAAVSYPKQYSPTAWPYIGPFYPYPQVPLGWRKVTLEWDDGWWHLDFKNRR